MIKSRAMLLAGVSALAMLACVAEADAETFVFTGAAQSFPVLVSGEYSLDVLGASGGLGFGSGGGLGAEVSGDIVLTAGENLTLFVGGRGQFGAFPVGGAAAAAAASSFSEPVSLLSLAAGAAGGPMRVAVAPDRPGPPAELGEVSMAGRAARAGAAAAGGPILAARTAAAARVSTSAPPGTGPTALALTLDPARNFPMAAPALASARAASAAAAAAASATAAEAGAGSPAAAAAPPPPSAMATAAAAPFCRTCSPIGT
jgi:hypothetical protein